MTKKELTGYGTLLDSEKHPEDMRYGIKNYKYH
jgi:hypothetical protein